MTSTTIKLTTPEAFDNLIEYLEKKRGLEWPAPQYRGYFIEDMKEKMKTDTVLLEIVWEYSLQKQDLICHVRWSKLSEMPTDASFLADLQSCDNNQ